MKTVTLQIEGNDVPALCGACHTSIDKNSGCRCTGEPGKQRSGVHIDTGCFRAAVDRCGDGSRLFCNRGEVMTADPQKSHGF